MGKRSKVRQYSFGASNSKTRKAGTFFFEAKNLAEAEDHRWHLHGDPSSPITCSGYVGPLSGSSWVYPEDVRGFVDDDVLRAEYLATLPEIDHDPALLKQFIKERGRQPERGSELGHNLLNPKGRVIEIAYGTSNICDPRSEAYHSF